MAEQARCKKCKIRYIFDYHTGRKIVLKNRDFPCPECGTPLTATNHLCKDPMHHLGIFRK